MAEVDESNGEDRLDHPSDRDHAGNKGALCSIRPCSVLVMHDIGQGVEYQLLNKTILVCDLLAEYFI